jgi:hypothetical protein
VGASPTRHSLQPEATGADMEETKCLKPSDSGSRNTVTARVCRPHVKRHSELTPWRHQELTPLG